MSRRGIWSRHYLPSHVWDERDWKGEWREVRYQPLNKEPVPPQPLHTAPTWSLPSEAQPRRCAVEACRSGAREPPSRGYSFQ